MCIGKFQELFKIDFILGFEEWDLLWSLISFCLKFKFVIFSVGILGYIDVLNLVVLFLKWE